MTEAENGMRSSRTGDLSADTMIGASATVSPGSFWAWMGDGDGRPEPQWPAPERKPISTCTSPQLRNVCRLPVPAAREPGDAVYPGFGVQCCREGSPATNLEIQSAQGLPRIDDDLVLPGPQVGGPEAPGDGPVAGLDHRHV